MHRVRIWGECAALAGLLILALLPGARAQSGGDPVDAVFQLEIVAKDGTGYKGTGYGTGFFINSDGTALTVSHVVYQPQHAPERYQLMAIIGREFYSAAIVCASTLRYDPTKPTPMGGVPVGRDVAMIKVTPPAFAFSQWGTKLKTGEFLPIASAHRGALPPFPSLEVGAGPGSGRVRVIGYGHISPIAQKWMAEGRVVQTNRAIDGTEIFDVEFSTGRPQPGNSGSPVLDEQNRVIGLWPWHQLYQSNRGTAISASALARPCP